MIVTPGMKVQYTQPDGTVVEGEVLESVNEGAAAHLKLGEKSFANAAYSEDAKKPNTFRALPEAPAPAAKKTASNGRS
jgi:hypothetical protein